MDFVCQRPSTCVVSPVPRFLSIFPLSLNLNIMILAIGFGHALSERADESDCLCGLIFSHFRIDNTLHDFALTFR